MTDQPYVIYNDYQAPAPAQLPDIPNELKCYKTGSLNVTNICHHSGRFLSAASEANYNILFQDPSLEFAGILQGSEAQGSHSQEFVHFLPYSPLKVLVIPGAILTLTGGVWLINLIPRLLSLSIGSRIVTTFSLLPFSEAVTAIGPLIAAGWGAILWPFLWLIVGTALLVIGLTQWRIYYQIAMSRPLDAIPLLSDHYNVQINEEITMRMNLTPENKINLVDIDGHGNLALEIFLDGQDIEKVRQAYYKKANKYGFKHPDDRKDDFNLGWLYVKATPHTQFKSSQHLLPMRQQFKKLDNPEVTKWFPAIKHRYQITRDAAINSVQLPEEMQQPIIMVKPTIKPYSAGYTLQIEFDCLTPKDWLKAGYESDEADATHRQFLEQLLDGKVESLEIKMERQPFIQGENPPIDRSRGRVSLYRNEVKWQNVSLSSVLVGQARKNSKNYPLTVTFSYPLTQLRVDTKLKIEYKIAVKNTSISGLTVDRNHFWLPNGHTVKNSKRDFTVDYHTLLSGELIVDPAMFAFEQELTAIQTIEQKPGAPLTSKIVTALVYELEELDSLLHIKSVTKSTPVTEVENGLAYQKRSWNISGRVYTKNSHPLDFLILLVSRTPLVADQLPTTTWGSVAFRCVQIKRHAKNGQVSENLRQEIKGRCLALCQTVRQRVHAQTASVEGQVARILGQS